MKTYIERDVRQIINVSNELKFVKFLTPDIIEEINREILGWNGAY